MTDSIQAAGTHDDSRFSRLFLSLLPFDDAPELLRELARVWRQIVNADVAAVVSSSKPSMPSFDVGVAFGDQTRTFHGGGSLFDLSPREQLVRISNLGDFEIGQNVATDRQLQFDGEPIGRVFLLGARDDGFSSSAIEEALDVTARLLQQSSLVVRNAELTKTLQEMKLESLAEFAAGAGHEINNPVATIAGRASLLLKDESDAERRRALTTIGGQAYRIRDMIGDLMLFGRPPRAEPEELVLDVVIREVLSKFEEPSRLQRCEFELKAAADLAIFADPTQLKVVLSELLQNALNASVEGGTITILAKNHQDAGFVCFSIADRGTGLTETDREHLFDPFYSGRQAGRGLGFGLCKCWRIITNHGGHISVSSDEDRGTEFEVMWPTGPVELSS